MTPTPTPAVDIAKSLATFARREHVQRHRNIKVLKLWSDLDRYRRIIEACKPETIVETGTRFGGSALWFRDCMARYTSRPQVITIDIDSRPSLPAQREARAFDLIDIEWATVTSSTDPSAFAAVRAMVKDRTVMVVLDSDHSAPHVRAEIEMYGKLVTPGQYLVVEDTIFDWAPHEQLRRLMLDPLVEHGGPLGPVMELLARDGRRWTNDAEIEKLHPTSHHPMGWWRRNA